MHNVKLSMILKLSRNFSVISIFTLLHTLACPAFAYLSDSITNGAISNSTPLEVDAYTGSISTSFSVEVPPGRNGIRPELNLSYNGSGRDGFLGTGWFLNIGSIERSSQNGVPKYDSSDEFVFQLNNSNQKLINIPSTNQYHMEIEGEFTKIENIDPYWIVTDKKGVRYYFGETDQARERDPGSPSTRISKWYLERVVDVHGNEMELTYMRDGEKVYPSKIEYTGNPTQALSPYAEIRFSYINRTDIQTGYIYGFLMESNLLLDKIEIFADSNLQRSYELGYTASSSTQKSLLTTIQTKGSDGSAFPAVTSYQYQSDKGVTLTSGWNLPANITFSAPSGLGGYKDYGVRFVDLNGDAYPDIVRSYKDNSTGSLTNEIYIHDRINGWELSSTWSLPSGLDPFIIQDTPFFTQVVNNRDKGIRIADIDGDGYNDLIQHLRTGPILFGAYIVKKAHLNNTNGWGADNPNWYPPDAYPIDQHYFVLEFDDATRITDFWGVVLADVNADGYVDIFKTQWGSGSGGSGSSKTFLNAKPSGGTGWTEDSSWAAPISQYTAFRISGDASISLTFADLNGDRLPDLFYKDDSTAVTHINSGDNWFNDSSSPWNNTFGIGNIKDGTTQLADINGDGLFDMIVAKGGYSEGSRVLINTGNGWFQDDDWAFPEGKFENLGTRILDANADGLNDFIISYDGMNPKLFLNTGEVADLLKTIDNGMGKITTIEYESSAHYSNTFLPFPIQVVKSVTHSDAMSGDSYQTTYEYSNGLWDATEREFRGFGMVKTLKSDGQYTETYYHQDKYKQGRIERQENYDINNSLLSKTENSYTVENISSGVNFVYIAKTDNYIYDNGLLNGHRTQTEFYYEENPQYGNLTKTTQLGEVDFITGDNSNYTGDERTVINDYHNVDSGGGYLIGVPKRTEIQDADGTKIRESFFYYDDDTAMTGSPPTVGLLVRKEEWAGIVNWQGDVNPVTAYTYDNFGNLLTITDPENNTTTITYDTIYRLFPVTTQNALTHNAQKVYYGVNAAPETGYSGLWGQLKSFTDPNNETVKKVYDSFGRPVATVSPLDSINYPTSQTVYEIFSDHTKMTTMDRIKHGKPETIDTVTFYDGLGRTIQRKRESGTPGQYIVSGQVEYDIFGRPEYKYLPQFTNEGLNIITAIDTGKPKTQFIYDNSGRVVQTINPDGTYLNVQYDLWTTAAIDENGHRQETDVDAYGRLIEKRDYIGADGRDVNYPVTTGPVDGHYTLYTRTTYDYDSEGNLVEVIQDADGAALATSLQYDELGHKINMADPDMGTWQYEFDLNGNLKAQIDNKDKRIEFDYDGLNRLETKNLPATTVDYTYDDIGVTYSKGRLTQVAYPSAESTDFIYDQLGREIHSEKVIDGSDYTINRGYDALNNLIELGYPDQEEISYIYNDIGQVVSIIEDTNMGDVDFDNQVTFSDADLVSQYVLGQVQFNAEQIKRADVNDDGAINAADVAMINAYVQGYIEEFYNDGDPEIYVANVQYNAHGQMTKVELGNNTTTYHKYFDNTLQLEHLKTFAPDTDPQEDVNGWALAPGDLQNLSYTYDSVGNILTITDSVNSASQSFQYDALNRLVQATGQYCDGATCTKDYQYDEIGNIIVKDGLTYYYNECNGGPHAVCRLSDGTLFDYDDNGNMVSKTDPNGKQWTYVYNVENRLKKVKINGQLKAEYMYDGDGGRTRKKVYADNCIGHVSSGGGYVAYCAQPRLLGAPVPTEETHFIGSLYQSSDQGQSIKYILFDGQRIASISGTKVLYYHADHLGSANVITDVNGVMKEISEYEPYGDFSRHEKFGADDEVAHYYFTAQFRDDESGLYFYNARYYMPLIGRFISPDTIVQSPSNTQTLNRYTYANNNPVNNIDPSGHGWFKKFWKSLVGAIIGTVVGISTGNPWLGFSAYNAFTAGVSGGNIGAAVGGALAGYFGGGLIGNAFGGFWGTIGAGALGGAAGAGIGGGNVGLAALSGLGGSFAGYSTGAITGLAGLGTIVGGGVGSEIAGGNFGEGALGGVAYNVGFTLGSTAAGWGYQSKETAQIPEDSQVYFAGPRIGKEGGGWLGKVYSAGMAVLDPGPFNHTGIGAGNGKVIDSHPDVGDLSGPGIRSVKDFGGYSPKDRILTIQGSQGLTKAAMGLTINLQDQGVHFGGIPLTGTTGIYCSQFTGQASQAAGQPVYGKGPNSQYWYAYK